MAAEDGVISIPINKIESNFRSQLYAQTDSSDKIDANTKI